MDDYLVRFMKQRFITYPWGKVYQCQDTETGRQWSLRSDQKEAEAVIAGKERRLRPALH